MKEKPMPLNPDVRARHNRYVERLRELGVWAGQEAADYLAVAEYLKACENLLIAMRDNRHDCISPGFQQTIAALLGSDAAEVT